MPSGHITSNFRTACAKAFLSSENSLTPGCKVIVALQKAKFSAHKLELPSKEVQLLKTMQIQTETE